MSKILYNKYKDRLEITGDNKVAFYSQKREQLKTLYNDKYVVDLGGGLGYNVSRKFIPNLESVGRRFLGLTGTTEMVDIIAGRNASIISYTSESDFLADMNPIDDVVDTEYLFFDKSNVLIWKDEVRGSIYYDSLNPYNWHSSELTQQFIYDNIQDAEKYKWWSKEVSGSFKDLFLYNTALEGSDICPAKNYVGLGEVYDVADAHLIACSIDTTPAITILEDTTILTDNTILE